MSLRYELVIIEALSSAFPRLFYRRETSKRLTHRPDAPRLVSQMNLDEKKREARRPPSLRKIPPGSETEDGVDREEELIVRGVHAGTVHVELLHARTTGIPRMVPAQLGTDGESRVERKRR